MVRAGEREWLAVFEKAAVTTDSYGGEVSTWTEFTRAKVYIEFGTGQEKREAAQEHAEQTATFKCAATPKLREINVKDRILADGSAWDITDVSHLSRMEIRFTAIRSALR